MLQPQTRLTAADFNLSHALLQQWERRGGLFIERLFQWDIEHWPYKHQYAPLKLAFSLCLWLHSTHVQYCSKRQETWINLRQRETPNTFTRVQITLSFYNSCWYNTGAITTIKWGARKYNNESTCDEAITPTMCHRLLVARGAPGATALLMTTQPAFWIERHTNKKAKITSNKNTQIRKITSRDNDHTNDTHINCSSTMRWCMNEEQNQPKKRKSIIDVLEHCSPCRSRPSKQLAQKWHRCRFENVYGLKQCPSFAGSPTGTITKGLTCSPNHSFECVINFKWVCVLCVVAEIVDTRL